MIRTWMRNHEIIVMLLALAMISALAYLPLIGRIGYINDDWYLMYTAGAYGPQAFIDIFSVDRPARALVMMPAYGLFSNNPIFYNLSAYVLRLISALTFLWLLRMLWPEQSRVTFLASLLYLIYPGFLSQPNGIDYQSHILGLAAAQVSIALTVKAILTDRPAPKATFHVLSVLFGLVYLSQMEWYIGFEFFRWGCVYLLSSQTNGTIFQKPWRAIRSAYPAIAVPVMFLVWRIFFFQSERGATDVNVQFEQLTLHPVQTLYHWSVHVMQDLYDVTLSAWVTPLLQLKWYIQTWGIVLAIIAAGLFLYVLFFSGNGEEQDTTNGNFTREALLLGLFIAVGGLIPIAMVNRDVSFPSFSRYSLVSSAGVVILVSAMLMLVKQHLIRNGLAVLLIFTSVLTQHANTFKAAYQTTLTKDFWWQVSWRVPQFEKNTTLIATYPGVALEEDYFIWGPANLIYYPEKQNEQYIQPGLYAAILNQATVDKVLAKERQVYDKRKNIITYANYRNIVVMTQPGLDSCVHVLDGMQPEYSSVESDFIREIGSYSEIEHLLADGTPHTPPTIVFGPEPAHGWCYYYEKASLARQTGNWDEVRRLGDEARSKNVFYTGNLIEWIPFIQAYAMIGDFERIDQISKMNHGTYLEKEGCESLLHPSLSTDAQQKLEALFCQKSP
jgi:hypothetical protein